MTGNKTTGSMHDLNFVTSKDGTTIHYHKRGHGPGLILVHGVLSSSSDYLKLAGHLESHFTVYLIERRGRGRSGPQGTEYSIKKEWEDLDALQEIAQATILFGHSYGGLIALEYARKNSFLKTVVVYEPGISVDGAISMAWVPAYKKLLSQKKYLSALSIFSRYTGPAPARTTPPWLTKLLLLVFIRTKKRKKMYRLLPENLQEHLEVAKKDNTYKNYDEISANLLMLCGGKNRLEYVVRSSVVLLEVLPCAVLKVFPKLDHFGPDVTGPLEVATAIREFFIAHH